ncbi:hypothetical protein ACWEOZ_09745 [Actinoplanes sp. NPDC004185]
MDGPGFHVDIDALERAADGIVRTVDDQRRSQLENAGGSADVYGDEGLHGALTNFCDRWSDGLDLLTEDARTVGDILSRAAKAYRAVDSTAAARLPTDPGVQAVDG